MNKERGFTILELSLSMTMLSILMILIVISGMFVVNLYNRGISLKRINESGSIIGTELQNSLRHSNSSNITRRVNNIGSQTYFTGVCTGSVSYLWNIRTIGASTGNLDSNGREFNFIKISSDPTGAMCQPGAVPNAGGAKELIADNMVIRPPVAVAYNPIDSALVSVTFTISDSDDTSITDASGRYQCNGNADNSFCALNTFTITSYAKGIGAG